MNVLVVPSWYPPFGGRFFKYQAEELAKLGNKVDVLVLNEIGLTQKINSKIDASKSEFVNEHRSNYYRIPKLDKLNIKLYIKKFKKLLTTYLENNKVDIIHVHSAIWAAVVVSEIAKNKNIPYVITEHHSLFLEDKKTFSKVEQRNISYAFNNAKQIIAVSNEMKTFLKSYTSTKINVIPNMVNTDIFKPLEIEKDKMFTFISVGGLVKIKAYDILIEAFIRLEKDINQKIQLKIIGEGNELENLTKKARTSNNIHFLGYKTIEELVEEYNKANVFVSSSRKETFGVAIVEAMSCGLPIVATKCAGAKDIINKKVGFLAEIENSEDLYKKMKLIYTNYKDFNSETIRKEVVNKYSNEVVSKEINKILLNYIL